ncbi:MAG: hypothetical protein ACL7BU_12295 [Candidatus Phlomobacter fragariae]
MKPTIKINGSELGLFSSLTYVLERLIDCSKEGTPDLNVGGFKNLVYKVKHPDILNQYLVFHRNARMEGNYLTYTDALKKGDTFAVRGHNTTNVYIYRPQLLSDANEKAYLKIYNEKGGLFYTSNNLPLKIADVLTGPFPNEGHIDQMALVYINTVYQPANEAVAEIWGHSVSSDGIVAITKWTCPGYGRKDWGYVNNFGALLAYAPDAYPRWK